MLFITTLGELSIEMKRQIIALKRDQFSYTNNSKVTYTDEFDNEAMHIVYTIEGEVIAYGRICAANTFLTNPSFSRVCTHKNFQNKGYGRKIVEAAMSYIILNFNQPIGILVREKLIRYYTSFGFRLNYREERRDDGLHSMIKY